jgi:Domain of Unknown Function with PDB structure (DUF3862)
MKRVVVIFALLLLQVGSLPIAFGGGVTMEKDSRVEPGMTYDQVVKILGPPDQELSRSDMAGMTTVMYMWNGTSVGGNMNAMFQNGKLVNKAQFGLK